VRRGARRFVRRLMAAVRALAVASALMTLTPALARAGEPEDQKIGVAVAGEQGPEAAEAPTLDTGKLALQLLNFAVLAVVIGWFGGKAINKALLARHQQLKADLVTAAEARAAAEGRAAVQQKRLETLETEIANMRAGIKQEAEDEKQRLIAAAEARARSITEETKFLLDQQVKEAEITLRREVAEAAVKIAEQLVTKSMNAGDQQRLVDTFVSDVAAAPATSPTGRSS
jgi:F-type H+-transporting ATPase subunit b